MRKQTRQVVIRMTENDFIKMKIRVKFSGKKQAEFLRNCILKTKIISFRGIDSLLIELKKIGNNINQIAKKCNTGHTATYEEIKKQGDELREVISLLTQQLVEKDKESNF